MLDIKKIGNYGKGGLNLQLSKTRCGIREWESIRKRKEYDGQLCLL